MFKYTDKRTFQPGRRRVLLAIGGGGIIALAGCLNANAEIKKPVNLTDKDEFTIVGNWVVLNQDLL